MKIIKRTEEVYDFDLEAEIKRLHECFKGKQLKRQLAIIDAMFTEQNLEKVKKLYYGLPYCSKGGCAEQEYVGLWLSIFTGGCGERKYLVDQDITYEF